MTISRILAGLPDMLPPKLVSGELSNASNQ